MTARPRNTQGIKFKCTKSAKSVRSVFAAKFYIAVRTRGINFKILSKILKLAVGRKFQVRAVYKFQNLAVCKAKSLFKFSRISKFNHKNAIIGAKFLRL